MTCTQARFPRPQPLAVGLGKREKAFLNLLRSRERQDLGREDQITGPTRGKDREGPGCNDVSSSVSPTFPCACKSAALLSKASSHSGEPGGARESRFLASSWVILTLLSVDHFLGLWAGERASQASVGGSPSLGQRMMTGRRAHIWDTGQKQRVL